MLPILYCQCHACWCPGDFRSQGINRHGVISSIRRVNPAGAWPVYTLLVCFTSHIIFYIEGDVTCPLKHLHLWATWQSKPHNLCITGPLFWASPLNSKFPAQRASYVERMSMLWHYDIQLALTFQLLLKLSFLSICPISPNTWYLHNAVAFLHSGFYANWADNYRHPNVLWIALCYE